MKRDYTFRVLLTTREAAVRLGVSISRIHQLIQDGRLRAREFGPVYVITLSDLEAVEIKKTGRPRKETAKPGRPRQTSSKKPAPKK